MHPIDEFGQPAALFSYALVALWIAGGALWALCRHIRWVRAQEIDASVIAHHRMLDDLERAEGLSPAEVPPGPRLRRP